MMYPEALEVANAAVDLPMEVLPTPLEDAVKAARTSVRRIVIPSVVIVMMVVMIRKDDDLFRFL